jgi:hypothetical protein
MQCYAWLVIMFVAQPRLTSEVQHRAFPPQPNWALGIYREEQKPAT